MLASAKKLFIDFISFGSRTVFSSEVNQQIVVSNLFSFIGYTLTITLGISSLLNHEFQLGLGLLLAGAIFAFGHFLNGVTKIPFAQKLSVAILMVCLLSLMVYLVAFGGYKNTGPLWVFIVPPIMFYFCGLKQGCLYLFIFVLIISCILFLPFEFIEVADYPLEFKTRLLMSFLTVTLLFGFYEYSREKSIERIQTLSDRFERQAMQDSLTKIPNRRGITDYIKHECERAKRSGKPLSFLLCDIDYFKSVNDNYGHDAGDYLLEQISMLFKKNIRKQDKVARWGGEEFLFLLPETTADEAFILAEKLRIKLSQTSFKFKKHSFSVTMSIGVEMLRGSNFDKAISHADKALYEAKKAGRNNTQPHPEAQF